MLRKTAPILAVLLALLLPGCGSRSLNTIDDVSEFIETLTGSPTTTADRLKTILTAHDRTDAKSWPLLPNEEGESQLRTVIRAIDKIEETPFELLIGRAKTLAILAGVAQHSASRLVRSRATLAVARLGKSLPVDPPESTKAPTDVVLTEIHELLKKADGAVPKKDRPETPAMRKTRREALMSLAAYRFWPPETFAVPMRDRRDAFMSSRRWTRNLIGYFYRGLRFLPDLEDPDFAAKIDTRLDGLVAEFVRYEVCRAMLRDDDRSVRYDAVNCVRVLGTKDLLPALAVAAAEEPIDLVRLRVAQTLTEMGALDRKVSVPALIGLLGDHRLDVRHAAYGGLRLLTARDHGEEMRPWMDWWATQR
jgi:hypothetical protein